MHYRNKSPKGDPLIAIIPHGASPERELASQTLNHRVFKSHEILQILCDGPLRSCDRADRVALGSRALTTCARCIGEQGVGVPSLLLSNFLTSTDVRDVGSYLLTVSEALHTNSSPSLRPFDGIDPTTFLRSPLADRFPDLLQEAAADQGLRAFLIARGITLDTDHSTHLPLHPDRLPRLEASLLSLRAIRSILASWQPTAILSFGSAGLITTAVIEAATLEKVPSAAISLTPEGIIKVQRRNSQRRKDEESSQSDNNETRVKVHAGNFSTDEFFDKDHFAVRLAQLLFPDEGDASYPAAMTAASC